MKDVACGLGHTLALLVNGEVLLGKWCKWSFRARRCVRLTNDSNCSPIAALGPLWTGPVVEASSVCCYPKDIKKSPSGQQRVNERQIPSIFLLMMKVAIQDSQHIVAVFSGRHIPWQSMHLATPTAKTTRVNVGLGQRRTIVTCNAVQLYSLPPAEKSVCYASSCSLHRLLSMTHENIGCGRRCCRCCCCCRSCSCGGGDSGGGSRRTVSAVSTAAIKHGVNGHGGATFGWPVTKTLGYQLLHLVIWQISNVVSHAVGDARISATR